MCTRHNILLHILYSPFTWFWANLNPVSFWLNGAHHFNIHTNQQQIKLNLKQASPWANYFTHPPRHALVISPTSCGTVWHVYSCTTKFYIMLGNISRLIHHYTQSCCIVNNFIQTFICNSPQKSHKRLIILLLMTLLFTWVSYILLSSPCHHSTKAYKTAKQQCCWLQCTMSNIF